MFRVDLIKDKLKTNLTGLHLQAPFHLDNNQLVSAYRIFKNHLGLKSNTNDIYQLLSDMHTCVDKTEYNNYDMFDFVYYGNELAFQLDKFLGYNDRFFGMEIAWIWSLKGKKREAAEIAMSLLISMLYLNIADSLYIDDGREDYINSWCEDDDSGFDDINFNAACAYSMSKKFYNKYVIPYINHLKSIKHTKKNINKLKDHINNTRMNKNLREWLSGIIKLYDSGFDISNISYCENVDGELGIEYNFCLVWRFDDFTWNRESESLDDVANNIGVQDVTKRVLLFENRMEEINPEEDIKLLIKICDLNHTLSYMYYGTYRSDEILIYEDETKKNICYLRESGEITVYGDSSYI